MTTKSAFQFFRFTATALVCLAVNVSWAGEPLHSRIDALIEATLEGKPVASTTNDAEFLAQRLPESQCSPVAI